MNKNKTILGLFVFFICLTMLSMPVLASDSHPTLGIGVVGSWSFETDKGGLANGFYSSSGYFCVSTKGRSVEEVTRTTVHELAHYFVDEDYEHFCKEGF